MSAVLGSECPFGCDLARYGTHAEDCELEPRDPPGYTHAIDVVEADVIHQRDEALAKLARVGTLHRDKYGWCAHCNVPQPCPTRRALDGEPS